MFDKDVLQISAATILAGMLANPNDKRLRIDQLVEAAELANQLRSLLGSQHYNKPVESGGEESNGKS